MRASNASAADPVQGAGHTSGRAARISDLKASARRNRQGRNGSTQRFVSSGSFHRGRTRRFRCRTRCDGGPRHHPGRRGAPRRGTAPPPTRRCAPRFRDVAQRAASFLPAASPGDAQSSPRAPATTPTTRGRPRPPRGAPPRPRRAPFAPPRELPAAPGAAPSNPPAISATNAPMSDPRSEQLHRRAEAVLPGGVNSPVRAFRAVGGHPVFIESARGARLVGADGREYIDFVGS